MRGKYYYGNEILRVIYIFYFLFDKIYYEIFVVRIQEGRKNHNFDINVPRTV